MGETELIKLDALVIGAGFGGLYMLKLLRDNGLSAKVVERFDDVGGVWKSNRYPGAKCDSPSMYYCYTFSEEIYKEWNWSSFYPDQQEILDYMKYVATKLDLYKDIELNTEIIKSYFDEQTKQWHSITQAGVHYISKYLITCIGNLTVSHNPSFPGLETFSGKIYHTSKWPTEPVKFEGKNVAVIGTGSSGVQSIPEIAKTAKHLTVFQRTAQYIFPACNRPISEQEQQYFQSQYATMRDDIKASPVGVPGFSYPPLSALEVTPEERFEKFEETWATSGGGLLWTYHDLTSNDTANKLLADYFHFKIKSIVNDPETAENLCPDYLVGGKRPILGTDYYETYNRDNVTLVNLKKTPIVAFDSEGIQTDATHHPVDIIVFATGFDAMSGPLMKFNLYGQNNLTFPKKWDNGNNLSTFLGIANAGFPNLFSIAGPHYPLTVNAPPVNEILAEYILEVILYAEQHQYSIVEATKEAEIKWTQFVNEIGAESIYAKVDSWYTGANIEGKPKQFYGFTGDFTTYLNYFNQVKDNLFEGFKFEKSSEHVNH